MRTAIPSDFGAFANKPVGFAPRKHQPSSEQKSKGCFFLDTLREKILDGRKAFGEMGRIIVKTMI